MIILLILLLLFGSVTYLFSFSVNLPSLEVGELSRGLFFGLFLSSARCFVFVENICFGEGSSEGLQSSRSRNIDLQFCQNNVLEADRLSWNSCDIWWSINESLKWNRREKWNRKKGYLSSQTMNRNISYL